MIFWSQKRLIGLKRRATDAQSQIQRLIEATAVTPKSGLVAWGQFLDAPRNAEQYGIYGTSSATQLLTAAGYSHANQFVRNARYWLPEIEPLSTNTPPDAQDIGLTLKCSAVLAAAERRADGAYVRVEAMEKRLRSYMIDGRGWGDYHYPTSADHTSKLLPTTHALLALQYSEEFRGSADCKAVLEWLAKTLLQQDSLPQHVLAYSGLALQAYPAQGLSLPDYELAMTTVIRQLERWVARHGGGTSGDSSSYHYSAPVGRNRAEHNHYMFYLPDVLTARVLLRLKEVPADCRTYLLSLVNEIAINVRSNNGFKATGSGRIACNDQLEVFCLLEEFVAKSDSRPESLLPKLVRILAATRAKQVGWSALLLTASIGGALVGLQAEMSNWIKAVGLTVATVGAGLLVALLWLLLAGGS